jgi:hypothetical protein
MEHVCWNTQMTKLNHTFFNSVSNTHTVTLLQYLMVLSKSKALYTILK